MIIAKKKLFSNRYNELQLVNKICYALFLKLMLLSVLTGNEGCISVIDIVETNAGRLLSFLQSPPLKMRMYYLQ